MPVEIVRAGGPLAEAWDSVTHQRSDIGSTATRRDFTGAHAVEQMSDLFQQCDGILFSRRWRGCHCCRIPAASARAAEATTESEAARRFGSTIHLNRGDVIRYFVADPVAISLTS